MMGWDALGPIGGLGWGEAGSLRGECIGVGWVGVRWGT